MIGKKGGGKGMTRAGRPKREAGKRPCATARRTPGGNTRHKRRTRPERRTRQIPRYYGLAQSARLARNPEMPDSSGRPEFLTRPKAG